MKKLFVLLITVLFLVTASVSFAADVRDNMNFKGETTVAGFSLKIATIAMTGVDYTLSAAQSLCSILVVSGSPSGYGIIAPTFANDGVSRLYTVRNAGSDSLGVIIKKSGGTGVTVGTGKTADVFWSGTDYVRKTSDATN